MFVADDGDNNDSRLKNLLFRKHTDIHNGIVMMSM